MGAATTRSDQEALARRWAASGAMALTGRAEGPPLVAPAPVVARVAELGERAGADALALLGERAAFADLTRNGDESCGGASRLLPAEDGWAAVTLARADDVELVPAWVETEGVVDPWVAIETALAERGAEALVERGRMLGLPVAVVGSVLPPRLGVGPSSTPQGLARLPVRVARHPEPRRRPAARPGPLVVDLSSLWAGPLCARLLGDAGADVVKVEAVHRPDGARRGPSGFFELLHGGHRSVALDIRTAAGIHVLGQLLDQADVVIEASRPRALAQLGLAAEDLLAADAGPQVWVSITGYGRTGDGRDRVAFGDDAAAAGGLVAWDRSGPCFVADAVADPLAGLVAAAATRVALGAGGSWLIDVAMAEVAAHVAAADPVGDMGDETWDIGEDVSSPAPPPVRSRSPLLGEHTDEVLAWLERPAAAESSPVVAAEDSAGEDPPGQAGKRV